MHHLCVHRAEPTVALPARRRQPTDITVFAAATPAAVSFSAPAYFGSWAGRLMMTDIDGGMPETGVETSGLSVPLITRGHTAAAANASRLRRIAALLQAPPAGFPGPGTKFSRPRTVGQRRRFPSFFHSGRFITFGHVFFIFSAYDEKTPFKAAKQSVFSI